MINKSLTTAIKKPLVGISCCNNKLGLHDFQMVADKYINAVVQGSNIIPVLIPSLGEQMLDLLPHLDGLYLTGSYSNLHPEHYNEAPAPANKANKNELRDTKRDHTNLALINKAVEIGMPVLGICRGFQEMNVALGGSLHQRLNECSNKVNHSEDKNQSLAKQYAYAHDITLTDNGILANIMKSQLKQKINSLHNQGVKVLAPSLKVEAVASDGLIEAISLSNNNSYFLGLQWHPEWQIASNSFYFEIFKSFSQACKNYQLNHH
ncbi:MAG: gamma-glutamyl-gamma-aminobutyrate hydrolase family protein [Colwellia sp.]|nr:gamma-glutamyl-gamma-aminobutyrate hydrolase family protein [Colwellia sp.]